MESSPEEFSNQRENFLHELLALDDLILRPKNVLIECEGHEILSEKIWNLIIASFLEIVFKINSTHQPQTKVEDDTKHAPGDDSVHEEGKPG